jgi:nucleotide-binding universal stress UspA family protein
MGKTSMFKNILAATDLTATCDSPVLTAAKIARQNQAGLYILHVLESASSKDRHLVKHFKTGREIVAGEAYEQTVKKEINRIYQKALKSCSDFEIRITVGFPWKEIIRWAAKEKADLIVIGPHSLRAREKGVVRATGKIGSTVEGVLMRESCPVMIANKPISKEMLKFNPVMVNIDFSKSCECALAFAVNIAQKFSSTLFIFHMIPIPPYPKYTREDYEADVDNAKARLENFCRKIPEGVEYQIHVRGGALPHLEILKEAETHAIDLIVMGSHTKEKTGKWYLGSVVEQVSGKSLCPVIVVTDPAALLPWKDDAMEKTGPDNEIDRLIHVFSSKQNV